MSDIRIDLGPVVRQIEEMGRRLATSIDSVGTEVGQARSDIQLTAGELARLRVEFETFKNEAERTANIQRSETKVGTLRDELDRSFGHYALVRRTSVGTLQAFDVGNVSNSTVTSVSEELMIQTPRYWLAPALVTLAAWSRDNGEMAEKSVQEAYARDKNKTSLFFALVLRRQGRQDGALSWLRHYVLSLDPSRLTREFAVILEASSYGAFGPDGEAFLSEVMDRWVSELRQNDQVIDLQIKKWAAEIGVQREQLNDSEFPSLRILAPKFGDLHRQLESASALPVVIEKYESIKNHDAPLPTHLENLLDDILDQLVTDFDEEELPLRREVAFHEAVIEQNGDMTRAQERAELVQEALEETTDVVSLQTMAAISPASLGVGTQTQRIAIGVGQGDFRQAVGRFCTAYRAAAARDYAYNFDNTHSNYARTYGFTGCQFDSATPEDEGLSAISRAWAQTFARRIEELRMQSTWYVKPGLIVLGVAVVLFLINAFAGIAAALVGAGVVYFLGEKEKEKRAAEIKKLESVQREAIADSQRLYRDANAELVDALLMYDEMDGHEADLLRLIDTWPTATHAAEEETA